MNLNNLFKNEKEEKFLSTYSNPFNSDKLECVTLRINKSIWSKKVEYTARIDFKSGDTSGDHKIKANDFHELIKNTEQFIKSLK